MKVKDFIEILKRYPEDMFVLKQKYSEYVLMEESDIYTVNACEPRVDGWVPRERPDKEVYSYLTIDGN